jgi:hypothetical protein
MIIKPVCRMKDKYVILQMVLFHGAILKITQTIVLQWMDKIAIMFGLDHI